MDSWLIRRSSSSMRTARLCAPTTTGGAISKPEIQATGLAPANDSEAALVHIVSPGRYTAIVRGAGGSTGVALAEVFVVNIPPTAPAPAQWGMRAPLLEANSELALAEANAKLYLLGGYPQSR
jgi:hypothetical protein